MEFKRWKNLGEIVPDYIEEFCNLYNEKEGVLKEIEEFAKETKTPILLPSSAALLRLLVGMKKPKRILEIGTGIGYSTLNMFFANPKSKVVTVDSNRKRLEVAESFFEKVGAPVETVLSDGIEFLRELICREETFDFIFVDSVKSEYPFFNFKFQAVLSPEGIAVFDNVLFRGYVAGRRYDRKYEKSVNLLRFFLESIEDYPNSEKFLIPVGDGLLIFKFCV
ncbi:MAG: O-methyltransferase [Thermovibrio sp.]|nr:MAG: O-methyltransferase [Thermovibrio sp.]